MDEEEGAEAGVFDVDLGLGGDDGLGVVGDAEAGGADSWRGRWHRRLRRVCRRG